MASPSSSWSDTSSIQDELQSLISGSSNRSDDTRSGLPNEWFDDSGVHRMNVLIQHMDLMNGEMPRHWIENLDVNTPMNHFDFVGYLLEHEIVEDDTLVHLVDFEVYHSHRHVQQIDLAGTWAQNGVDGGQILYIIPVFRELDLHFRICMADVRRTIVIQASVNDTMPFILHEMKGRVPEIREMVIDDLKVFHNDDLVNHDLRRYLHEVINYEEDKPFYSFHVLIQVRGGTNRPVMKKHLKKDQAVKELSKRSVDLVKRMYGSPDTAEIGDLPQVLRPVVQPVVDLMTQVRTRMNNNEDIWVEALNHLDDNQLETFKSIFDTDPRNKLKTEVRLYQACSSMVSNLEDIDKYIEHLKKVKLEVISLFIEAYAMKHSEFGRAGAIEYCNIPYFNEITAVINYRNGLRRRAVNAVEDEGDRNENNGGQNCTIM